MVIVIFVIVMGGLIVATLPDQDEAPYSEFIELKLEDSDEKTKKKKVVD